MVATDADGIPARNIPGTIGKYVGGQPHRGTGREDMGAPGNVLLEYVILGSAV